MRTVRLGGGGVAGAGGDIPNGLSRPPEPEATDPADVLGTDGDPAAGVCLVEFSEDQGRQAMRAIAKSPAAMPIAIRADLKMVWLRFSSWIAADA